MPAEMKVRIADCRQSQSLMVFSADSPKDRQCLLVLLQSATEVSDIPMDTADVSNGQSLDRLKTVRLRKLQCVLQMLQRL